MPRGFRPTRGRLTDVTNCLRSRSAQSASDGPLEWRDARGGVRREATRFFLLTRPTATVILC